MYNWYVTVEYLIRKDQLYILLIMLWTFTEQSRGKYILGQANGLQVMVALPLPAQALPLNRGAGFVHVLDRLLDPLPHVFEHDVQLLQLAHWPWTGREVYNNKQAVKCWYQKFGYLYICISTNGTCTCIDLVRTWTVVSVTAGTSKSTSGTLVATMKRSRVGASSRSAFCSTTTCLWAWSPTSPTSPVTVN